jgi:hypothetical protein
MPAVKTEVHAIAYPLAGGTPVSRGGMYADGQATQMVALDVGRALITFLR